MLHKTGIGLNHLEFKKSCTIVQHNLTAAETWAVPDADVPDYRTKTIDSTVLFPLFKLKAMQLRTTQCMSWLSLHNAFCKGYHVHMY